MSENSENFTYDNTIKQLKYKYLREIEDGANEKQKYETLYTYKIWKYSFFTVGEARKYTVQKTGDNSQDFMTVKSSTHIMDDNLKIASNILKQQIIKAHNLNHPTIKNDKIIRKWNFRNTRHKCANCFGFLKNLK
jgi:hypothetical protein